MARTKTVKLSLLASALLPFLSQGSQIQTEDPHGLYPKAGQTLALTHATLITAPGEKREDATLVVRDGRILAVDDKAPAGARVIDVKGAWIYPGFIDPYSNYGLPTKAYEGPKDEVPHYRWPRPGAQAHNAAVHGSEVWRSRAKADMEGAKPFLEDGFTSVASARLDGIFQGYSVSLSLADLPSNQLVYQDKGRQFMAFDKGSSPQVYPTSLMGAMALVRQTLSDAAWYKDALNHDGARAQLETNADLAALGALKQQGILLATRHEDELLSAANLFKGFGLNPVYLGSNFEYDRADEVAKVAKTVVLPLNFPKPPKVASEADLERAQLADLRHWERAPSTAAALTQRGVAVAFSRHGLEGSIWPEVKKAIKDGLSEDQALAALTTVPAKIGGVDGIAGQLKAGMMADFVIASGDIFQDGKVLSTWTQGQPHSQVPLDLAALWGDYQVAGDYALTVKDDGSVSLKQGDKAIDQLTSNYEDRQLQLRWADDAGSHYWVLSGSHKAPVISAQQGGAWQSLVVTAKAPEAKKEDKADDAKLVSRASFPDQAYGLAQHPKSEKLLIKNATVWTSEKAGILDNTDVLIDDGVIEKLGKHLDAPRGATVIDGTGKHLTAGIIDEHSHIAISGGVNEASEAVTSEVRVGDVINPNDISIYRALAGGTTSAQLLHGSANPIGGQAQMIKLRWGETAEDMKFKEAPGTIKFALGENVKQSNWGDNFTIRYPQSRMGVKSLMEDAFQTAREYQEARTRYDLLSKRNKNEVLPPRRDYRLDALVEIMNKERFVHAHSYVASEILALMEVADEFDFHIQTFTHILEGYKVADEMKAHGATASTFADWWAYKFEVYDAIAQNACLLNQKGVLTSINSDSEDLIRRLNLEAAKSMAYCGMSPEDAWKMATINPAKELKVDKYVGSIKEGKQADLVLWDASPLSARARVLDTWVDGKRYFDRERDLAERQAIKAEKATLIDKILKSGEKPAEDRKGYRPAVVHWHCEDMDSHLEEM
ncbi:amidohydrolase family protein [Gallaecimonas kandeliae]|uniref:amidohydrolase family protein n=1 Tax=Gallaecimonas kandeliae TaxID=3029055 RepID=UPI0026471214|nr:amidohydrolase family protein [Gallaecimonas kandeliae]WKE64503.1 amidohydrolase family protein [Gallaecimonas kandeliae]